MNHSKTLITGATGLVGSKLVKLFDNVCMTTRSIARAKQKFGPHAGQLLQWSGGNQPLDLTTAGPISTVINLMGEPIDGRWTSEKKTSLRASRVDGTKRLVEAIGKLAPRPKVMVSASAVGFYGDNGDREITEETPNGSGFLAELCHEWENTARQVESLGVRLVILRIGIVLDREGGALKKMVPIFKTGLAGRLGNGKQFFPWIHSNDLVQLIRWAATNESVEGVYNATAETPVTNADFTRYLAKILRRPAFLPAPRFGLRLMLGEFADSLLVSHRAVPQAALKAGFEFQYKDIGSALTDLLA